MMHRNTKSLLFQPLHLGILSLLAIVLMSSCGTVRYLKDGERYLKKNKIYWKHASGVHNKKKLKYELTKVYAQRPNRSIIFINRRWFHYRVARKTKSTKFNRWVNRRLAEKPAIIDSSLIEKSVQNLTNLMGQKGYFDAEVTYKVKHRWRRKDVVNYYVTPHEITIIDSSFLVCPDTNLYDIIMAQSAASSFIKPLAPLTLENYNKDVTRIVRLLRNHGYAKFNRSHIAALETDTTGQKNIVRMEVYPYKDSLNHPKFNFGDITVYHRFKPSESVEETQDTLIQSFLFSPVDKMEVKPQTIASKISLTKGFTYRLDDIEETQRMLAKLTYFRSVNINQKMSESDSSKMDINIYMTPKKKMSVGYLFDLNNSNVGSTGQNGSFLGLGANINYEHRNVFKGSEMLRLNLDAGLDISLIGRAHINSSNFSFTGDLYFPKYINTIPFINIGKWLRNKRLDQFSNDVRKFSTSKLTTSFSFVKIPNWYRYQLLKSNIGITYYGKSGNKLTVNNIGLDYFNPQPDEPFIRLTDSLTYLERSFRKQLFTGFVLKDISYNSGTHTNLRGSSFQWGGNFEVSGLLILGLNQTYNLLTKQDAIWRLGKNNLVDYSKFMKLDLHTTFKRKLTPGQTIGAKFTIGAAVPLADTKTVPYVAQFYSGGANSIRGWSIRELGPGGFVDPVSSLENYRRPYYQSGDLKLEMMSEWRFDLYWIFKGAFFLDVGNVWTWKEDEDRPGAELTKDFYKQIAVSSGFGLRVDLTYFILRFDFGLKMRNPYPNEDNYYWLNYGGGFKKISTNDFNMNIQVGYPF